MERESAPSRAQAEELLMPMAKEELTRKAVTDYVLPVLDQPDTRDRDSPRTAPGSSPRRRHSPPKVTGCTGSDAEHSTGVDCSGTSVTGGALVGGDGHVVVGDIVGAGHGDVGHTIAVRLHGGSAHVPGLGTPIILGILGLVVIGLAGWVILRIFTGKAGGPAPPAWT